MLGGTHQRWKQVNFDEYANNVNILFEHSPGLFDCGLIML